MKKFLLFFIICNSFYSNVLSACESISSYYLDSEVILNKGARDLGVQVIDAKAVKSGDFKNFYFVQYKMNTPSNGVVYPMFAMNKPKSRGGIIYSMDDLAVTLTGFGDGRRTRAKFSSSDDGYYEASRCLK